MAYSYNKRPDFLKDIDLLRKKYPGKYLQHRERKILYSFTAYIDSDEKAPNLFFVRNIWGDSFSFLFGFDKEGEESFKVIR